MAAAEKLKMDLEAAGFRVNLDTRDMRPGAKYYWWELRGVPLRLELGPRDLDAGKAMAVKRGGGKTTISLATAADDVTRVLGEITEEIRAKAEEHTKSHLCTVDSMDALNSALNEGKVAVVHWCRERGCGDAIEEKANSSLLGTDVRSEYVEATDGPCIICKKPGKATLVGRTY
jgi:prolyl-tRNA synthetase